ncbi:MAG: hypothetical protein JKY56_04725 [Kofleriaceae bacterium]|nr:hypothetical protein [Kofleriaceae bacterium]
MATPYRTILRPSLRASIAMLSGAAGVAILLALLWPHVGVLGNIAIVSVFIRALVVGKVLAWISYRTHFSWPKTAALLAGLSVVLAIFGAHYFQYREKRADAIRVTDEFLAISADADIHTSDIDEELAGMTFMNYESERFGFTGQAEDGTAAILGSKIGLGFFLIELLFAILVSMYYPAGVASEPSCRQCGRWLPERHIAHAAYGRTPEFTANLLRGEAEAAFAILAQPDTEEMLLLSLAECLDHRTGPDNTILRLRETTLDRRSRDKVLRHRAVLILSLADKDELQRYEETLCA